MARRDRWARLRGRSSSGRFALLPQDVLKHPAVTSLSAAVFKVLVAVAAQYSGGNNGALALTRAMAREYGITSNDTLRRSLAILCSRRIIDCTDPGSHVPPRPARYSINWKPLNDTEWTRATRTPSHAYRTICDDLSAGHTGPTTGPTNGSESPKKGVLGPAIGPNSENAGSGERPPLDIYHVGGG